MARDSCITDFPPDLHERAESSVQEEILDLDRMTREEMREYIHDLRVSRAELQFRNEALRQACDKNLQRADEAFALLECSPDMIVRLDRDLRIQYINPKFKQVTGIPEEQAIGCMPSELEIPKDLASAFELKARFVFDTGQESTLTFEYTGMMGKQFFHTHTIPEHYENGQIVTIISTLRDITNLVETQEKLREREEQYRHIVETANEGIWTIDTENRTTFVNQKLLEMFGYTPEEMLGKTPFDFIPPEEREKQKEALDRRSAGIREQLELRYVRKK